MLRKLTSILLVIVTLAALVRCTFPYVWYFVNYEYIVTELCVNRDNPEMHCDGSCQLEKMIHKQHHHDHQKPAPPVTQEQKINLFIADHLAMMMSPAHHTLPSFTYLSQMKTLWLREPVSPPPRIG